MDLSNDLLMQFAKITKSEEQTKKETTVYGTAVKYNGSTYVRFDGSELLTPVITTADFEDNERVSVLLKDHTATITGNLSAPSARNETVSEVRTDVTKVNEVLADTVRTEQLAAESARIDKLETKTAKIDTLEADNVTINNRLTATEAIIKDLTGGSIDVGNLTATFATIADLNVEKGRINALESDLGTIDTLIFGSATGTVIQTSFANSVIAQLGDAQIKSAMIQDVSASKITAGDIITNNVRVRSQDGSLIISDETMQISDGSRVRVQIGRDASNDYSINIWDASGNLMFSKGGITDSAIKNAIIRNDMVSDTANIAAHKLDINSLFEEINGSTNTIKSTRVYLDDKKQSLDVAFRSLSSTVTEQGETISSQGTAISTIQGQISSKIWQQDINSATGDMSTQYSTLSQDLTSFKTTVGDTYATKTALNDANSTISQLSTQISTNVTETTSLGTRVSTVEQTAGGLTARLNTVESYDISGRNLIANTACLTTTNCKIQSSTGSLTRTTEGLKLVCGSATARNGFILPLVADGCLTNGQKYTLSFEYRTNLTASGTIYALQRTSPNVSVSSGGALIASETEWQTFRITFSSNDINARVCHAILIPYVNGIGNWIEIRDRTLKLEKGTIATDWCSAHEDASLASKTATNYLNYSGSGLVVGDHTASTLGKNVLIDSAAVKVRTGSTVNAVFGADIIELAKDNESATISMLKGAFKIYYDADNSDGGFGVYGKTSDGKERLAFQPVNENNNLTLGWGGYADKANSTNLYGHKMYLTTNEDIILNPGSGKIQMDGNVILTNGRNLFGTNTSGAMRSMALWSSDDQILFGYGSYVNNEGTVYYNGNNIYVRSKNDIRLVTVNETVMLQDGDGHATYSAYFKPISNGKCTLGASANRWYAVYAANATIQTSDIREKENIVSLSEAHSALFDKLRPVQYNFIDGNGRTCYGLIAQEVISAMSELGIGEHELDLVHHDMGDNETNDTYGLAYSNLIAMLIYEVQKLKREVVWRSQNG